MNAEQEALFDEFDAAGDELGAITAEQRLLDARRLIANHRRSVARAALVAFGQRTAERAS